MHRGKLPDRGRRRVRRIPVRRVLEHRRQPDDPGQLPLRSAEAGQRRTHDAVPAQHALRIRQNLPFPHVRGRRLASMVQRGHRRRARRRIAGSHRAGVDETEFRGASRRDRGLQDHVGPERPQVPGLVRHRRLLGRRHRTARAESAPLVRRDGRRPVHR